MRGQEGMRRPFGRMLPFVVAFLALAAAPAAQGAPIASFEVEPEAPITHQPVTFTSTATAGEDRTIVGQAWDLDDDGEFDDATGSTATWTFTRPGPRSVALRVTDSADEPDARSRRVVVGNRAPLTSFVLVPAQPAPGRPLTLLSTSYDPDGFITGYGWDLDGDGAFDDAAGSSVSTSFPFGRHLVGLQATDDAGGTTASFLDVIVGDESTGGSGVRSSSRLLSPFPVVRLSGIFRPNGVRLRLLSVSGPVGATVRVLCGGKGCPFKRSTRPVESRVRPAAGWAPATGLVRIRRFARRLLRTGAIIRIFVTTPDSIGKYTRLKVRGGKLPARIDRCVMPGSLRPLPCPAG